jgi:hypothetical protein
MSVLVHEVWNDTEGLPGICLAGLMGDGFRALLGAGATLIATIEADSHFEVMSKYYSLMGWGVYTTEFAHDHIPYSEDWLSIQRGSRK